MMNLAIAWALDRFNERSTWIGAFSALAGKLSLHFAPEFETQSINAVLGLVVLVSYVVKGGPVIIKPKA